MVGRRFGFLAEYFDSDAAFAEFEEFLRYEFAEGHPGWEPSFGRVSRYDRRNKCWDYAFLLKGEVPDAGSHGEAEEKVHHFLHGLNSAFRLAHANPGYLLPDPVISVWQWDCEA